MQLSGISLERLDTCNPHLQRIVKSVAEEIDIQVIDCNSSAVDIAPLTIVDGEPGIDWTDKKAFENMANIFMKYAYKYGIRSWWAGDFYDNGNKTATRFELRD